MNRRTNPFQKSSTREWGKKMFLAAVIYSIGIWVVLALVCFGVIF
jgi:hypothetical protein